MHVMKKIIEICEVLLAEIIAWCSLFPMWIKKNTILPFPFPERSGFVSMPFQSHTLIIKWIVDFFILCLKIEMCIVPKIN